MSSHNFLKSKGEKTVFLLVNFSQFSYFSVSIYFHPYSNQPFNFKRPFLLLHFTLAMKVSISESALFGPSLLSQFRHISGRELQGGAEPRSIIGGKEGT